MNEQEKKNYTLPKVCKVHKNNNTQFKCGNGSKPEEVNLTREQQKLIFEEFMKQNTAQQVPPPTKKFSAKKTQVLSQVWEDKLGPFMTLLHGVVVKQKENKLPEHLIQIISSLSQLKPGTYPCVHFVDSVEEGFKTHILKESKAETLTAIDAFEEELDEEWSKKGGKQTELLKGFIKTAIENAILKPLEKHIDEILIEDNKELIKGLKDYLLMLTLEE